MNTTPPNACPAWRRLEAHAGIWRGARLAELLASDPARALNLSARAPGVQLDYSRQRVDALTLALLAQLAAERGFEEWRAALFAGAPINTTEGRAVRHAELRAGDAAPAEVKAALQQTGSLAQSIRAGRRFTRIVSLGAGGSDLGPRLLADAFGDGRLDVRFVASVDPLELQRALAGADPESTLIVVVSKTFTTQETLANATAARHWGCKSFYAVTANAQAARQFGAGEVLPMWDWVGGRFSVWSAVSFAAICAIGGDAFAEFLSGGHDIDRHFLETPIGQNVPGLMALLGVWNVNFLGAQAQAVMPYAHRLRLLPAYLQQLEMESNGKGVDREDRALGYATCPVLFGSEGTPSQHSFHQLLHQGTQAVPADFIVAGIDPVLDANAEAQAQALAVGTAGAVGTSDASLPAHRRYPGNRPSSTLRLDRMDARTLGRLLAIYEHKVFAQGVLWNINSFDQWGVELGKEMAKKILGGAH
ncbi:MAG: glucose-6-phosphate isomerase [Pseudomonadota bacterium]